MKTRAIIIEDEKLTADRLEQLVHSHTEVDVTANLSSMKSAVQWLQQNPLPDIVFLDIQLGDGSGFDVLDAIDAYPHVIFTTAFDQYVMEAFKHNSLDYLLKPVQVEELQTAVQKFDKVRPEVDVSSAFDQLNVRLFKKYKRKFLVKIGMKYRSVSIEEIGYFHSQDSVTYLCSKGGNFWIIDQSLEELESLLDPQSFFRINRHMIISENQISSIDSYFNSRLSLELMPAFAGDVIVSREKVKAFKNWLDE
ncbi:MAG: response regulator transcription factor [Cytophagales bacterium]|nr:response regulator transcription factor [Cytophagales bacterium]